MNDIEKQRARRRLVTALNGIFDSRRKDHLECVSWFGSDGSAENGSFFAVCEVLSISAFDLRSKVDKIRRGYRVRPKNVAELIDQLQLKQHRALRVVRT